MGFTISPVIVLGPGNTGVQLQAQLFDATGTPVGGPLTGVVELDNGNYLWTNEFTTGFAGAVEFSNQDNNQVLAAMGVADTFVGTVLVDHNYGGANNLAYLDENGHGIAGAQVRAYLTSDWTASNYAADFIKGYTTTDVNGQWLEVMPLDAADYTFVFFKIGVFGADTKEQVVTT